MKAEIIAVGTELLIGQITNTNARYISEKLNEYGVSVFFHTVVGDNNGRIKEVLHTALSRSDIVVITGGLGPTEDDLTKEAVCEYLDIRLEIDEDILSSIEEYFKNRNITMVQSNIKQAYVPAGSVVLYNQKGTAPGFFIDHNEKKIVILPGPPVEMEPMFDDYLKKYIAKEATVYSRFINIFGVGESIAEERILDLIHRQSGITLATYANFGQVTIRVTTIAENSAEGEKKLKSTIDELHTRFGNDIYTDEDKSLSEKVAELLCKNSKTICVAESCTGGLVSKMLTDRAGASKFFLGGIVAYSNFFKMIYLSIPGEVLEKHGAVSEAVCRSMAENAVRMTNADIGLSVTGIAGPGGSTAEKPVGTVYIGICSKGTTRVKKCSFNGDRNKIRNMAAAASLDMIRRELL
jgi:nicotinamide-nucleotide amidase